MTDPTRIEISVAARSATGSCRDVNEDALHVIDLEEGRVYRPPLTCSRLTGRSFVFGVYDGRGHGARGTPSDFVAAEVEAWVSAAPIPSTSNELATHLREGVERGNRALFDLARTDRRGMGTTATVVGICQGGLAVAHVGDSRAYLLRDRQLSQLTRDHTLREEARAARALYEEDAEKSDPGTRWLRDAPDDMGHNILMRALGLMDSIRVDVSCIELRPGDRLLLCTDGLSAHVDDSRILTILEQHPEPGDACDAMVEAAERAGGYDNASVVLVTYGTS